VATVNTRALMGASAAFLGALGVAASFAPQEIVARYGADPAGMAVVGVQIAGALYLGIAMLDWMARGNLIGGIYSRPVALGNFVHYAVAAIVLAKAAIGGSRLPEILLGGVAYAVFAVLFGRVLFTHPTPAAQSSASLPTTEKP